MPSQTKVRGFIYRMAAGQCQLQIAIIVEDCSERLVSQSSSCVAGILEAHNKI